MPQDGLDRARAGALLTAAGLDALVVCEPEAFRYVTGCDIGVAGLFRRAGAGFAVLPADPALPVGAVVGDLYAADFAVRSTNLEWRSHPLWIETGEYGPGGEPVEQTISRRWAASRGGDFARPAIFDMARALAALHDLLASRRLAAGRLGFDFDFVSVNDGAAIRRGLSQAEVRDGSDVLRRLRMVKTPAEIAKLRLGAQLARSGLKKLTETVAAGQGAEDLRRAFRAGVAEAAEARAVPVPPSWEYISIGPDPWRPGGRVGEGAVIKADVGCVIEGYSSDTSRDYVFGEPSAAQARLHAILERAFDLGLAHIAPGRPLAGVHRAVTQALREAGLAGFSRGHFGHGLGQSLFSEQWPFIAADADVCFEPNMVVAFEVPIYVSGLGGFNIEDQLLVTEAGFEDMVDLPRELRSIGK
jgi:Xaa-Pro aminopeptidase